MKSVKKTFIMAAICMSLLIQTGCWDTKLYEDIGFILQMGMETGEEDKLLLSVTSPVLALEATEKVEFLSTSEERLVRASRERVRNTSGKMLQGGKIQMVYFSKELAQKGLGGLLEVFLRDPENPLLSNVVVVDKSPKEMLELSIKFKNKPRSAIYVISLLEDARRRLAVPETRVYNYSILTYSKTIDPVTPLIRYSKEDIEIAGAALFSGDRMVGQLDIYQMALLNILMGNKNDFEYIYNGKVSTQSGAEIKRGAAVSMKASKYKIKINTNEKKPVIDITLKFKATVDEYTGKHNLDQTESKKKLEETIAESVLEDVQKLLKYFQEVGADPVGFGERVRAKDNDYYKSVKWKEVYKEAQFKVKVEVNLETYGIIK